MDDHFALHIAAEQGNLHTMKQILLKDPKSYSRCDYEYLRPIHYAAVTNQSQAIKLLLEHSLDQLEYSTDYRLTPLHMAAENNAINAMKVLIENGADLTRTDNGSRTAMDIFLTNNTKLYKDFDLNKYKDKDYILWFLNNIIEQFFMAVKEDNYDTVLDFINKGLNIDITDINENNAIHYACKEGNIKMIKLLIDSGINTDVVLEDGV